MPDTLDEATETLPRCPGCGVHSHPDHKFCFNCGRAIREKVAGPSLGSAQTVRMDRTPSVVSVGESFADRFRVEEELGAGGMGVVYLVEEEANSTRFALKIMKPEFSIDPAARSRFEREIRILARIRHPSIPKIIEWGNHEDHLFFVSEFIEGRDLKNIIEEKGQIETRKALKLLALVGEALGSAHQAGVVHRDIKPSNIMVSRQGGVYLIDFGVARTVSAEMTKLTATGSMIGTPQYMAPEQIDSHRADERSDIYSLGIVLYEMLTGNVPFDGDTPMAIASKHLRESPPNPRSILPSLPFWLEKIILRCLEKEPSQRYWTVNELLTELRKSRSKGSLKKRTMPNGDVVTEDPSERNGWSLSISTENERSGWNTTITLYYKDSFYKLKRSRQPGKGQKRWVYQFDLWPEHEVMRRVVDYETEVSVQSSDMSIFSRAKNWLR